MSQNKKVLVTSALPYANGSIHLGHLVEYIQTDIWVRFLKMMGRDTIYICADDAHGTAIEIKASEEGITPEELIQRFNKEHYEDWPAMLKEAGLNMLNAVHVHGFLTVEGKKMSKSRGTFIIARTYLDHLDAQYLRYFYASKLGDRIDDIALSFKDFENRVNAELVNKIANLASRSISFLSKKLNGMLSSLDQAGLALVKQARDIKTEIARLYGSRNYSAVLDHICRTADSANLYFQDSALWALIKDDPEASSRICTAAINISRILAIYLQPVLPAYAGNIRSMLNEEGASYMWSDIDTVLEDREINPFTRLVEKVDEAKIAKMVEASMEGD